MSRLDQTFSLSNPQDLLNKLTYELRRVSEEREPYRIAYDALNGAISAWHMCDWVDRCLTSDQRAALAALAGRPMDDLRAIQQWARETSQHVRVCQHLANATKHWEVTAYADPRVSARIEYYVESAPSGGADVYVGLFVEDGNHQYTPRVLLAEALVFWDDILRRIGMGLEDLPFKSDVAKAP